MRYKICSSFPLLEMINFHKEKEQIMFDYQEDLRESDPKNELINQNLALITTMAARKD